MKAKSKKAQVRIKRALNELTEAGNHINIGCFIFEDMIKTAMDKLGKEIEEIEGKEQKNQIIPLSCYKETLLILKKHI
tara:strand:+ start:564 stop:797 length:234 start_codon:yes stop_codon:yes gene_type:complete